MQPMQQIKNKVNWILLRRRWFAENAHNYCAIQYSFDISKVSIGKGSYGMINPHFYNNPKEKLTIGSYCSISENVHFILGEHDYSRISTFPFKAIYKAGVDEMNPTKGGIKVEDDVWIGMNCLILSGVTIHQGAVIGAGSVVTKDVPPYAIYAGNQVKKFRFDEQTISQLLKMDFSKLSKKDIFENMSLLYEQVDESFVETDLYKKLCH